MKGSGRWDSITGRRRRGPARHGSGRHDLRFYGVRAHLREINRLNAVVRQKLLETIKVIIYHDLRDGVAREPRDIVNPSLSIIRCFTVFTLMKSPRRLLVGLPSATI